MSSCLLSAAVYVGSKMVTQAIGDHVKYHLRKSMYEAGVLAIGNNAGALVGNVSYVGPVMTWLGRGVGHIVMPSAVESSAAVTALATASSIATATVPVIASVAAPYLVSGIRAICRNIRAENQPADLDAVYEEQIRQIDDDNEFVELTKLTEPNSEG